MGDPAESEKEPAEGKSFIRRRKGGVGWKKKGKKETLAWEVAPTCIDLPIYKVLRSNPHDQQVAAGYNVYCGGDVITLHVHNYVHKKCI